VLLEDRLPAGFEPINESLATTGMFNTDKVEVSAGSGFMYFNHTEVRDDRVALFAEYVPKGIYEYMYRVRPTTPGMYHYPPAEAYNMYVPDISGHSSGGWIEIVE